MKYLCGVFLRCVPLWASSLTWGISIRAIHRRDDWIHPSNIKRRQMLVVLVFFLLVLKKNWLLAFMNDVEIH